MHCPFFLDGTQTVCKSEKNAWLDGMRSEEGKERGMMEKERGEAENRKGMMEKEKGDGGRRCLEKLAETYNIFVKESDSLENQWVKLIWRIKSEKKDCGILMFP